MKTKEEIKNIIFSNVDGSNCFEECLGDEYCDCDQISLEDERMNLDIETDGEIIAIADTGLWNGRRMGYKEIGNNVKNIFDISGDYVEWYSDGKNIKCTAHHHDGTNYIEYREIRKGKNIEKLKELIYSEEATPEIINKFTKSIAKYVNRVYGW